MSERRYFYADPHDRTPMGRVEYAVTETATGSTLAEGARSPALCEFRLELIEARAEAPLQGPLVQVGFSLDDAWWLCLAHSDPSRGFALQGDATGEHLFSWDWFTVGGAIATKLQEPGTLRLDFAETTELGPAIARTDFLTDVSIRVMRFPETPPESPNELHFDFRILIRSGSEVRWPTLREGEVVAS